MKILSKLCILTTIVSGADPDAIDSDVRMPFRFGSREYSGSFAVPIHLRIAETNRIVSMYAGIVGVPSLQIVESHARDLRTRADRVILGEELVIPVDLQVTESRPRITMSMDPRSQFMHLVGSLMIIPENANGGHIILNVTNPRSHVYRGELLQTRVFDDANEWTIGANFSAYEIASDTVRVVLNPFVPSSFIPAVVYNRIYRILQARGTFQSHAVVTLEEGTDIDLLPVLYLSLENTAGNSFTLAIPPSDYLVPTNQPNQYHLTLSADSTGRTFILGRNFLDKVALHLDPINRLIGFGDPHVEL